MSALVGLAVLIALVALVTHPTPPRAKRPRPTAREELDAQHAAWMRSFDDHPANQGRRRNT